MMMVMSGEDKNQSPAANGRYRKRDQVNPENHHETLHVRGKSTGLWALAPRALGLTLQY